MNKKNKNGKKFLDKIIDMFFESISYEEYDIEPIYQEEDKFYKKITNYKDVKFNIKSLFVSLLFIIPFPILSIYFGTKLHVIIGIVFVLMLVVTMFLYSIITVNMFDKLNDDVEGLV